MVDLNRPRDTCLFCGKPATKYQIKLPKLKEVIMQEKVEKQNGDMNLRERHRYITANLAEIGGDIKTMDTSAVMAKWGFKLTTYNSLRKRYAPELIGKRGGGRQKSALAPEQKPTATDIALTEHERYLILVGWQEAVRELLNMPQP